MNAEVLITAEAIDGIAARLRTNVPKKSDWNINLADALRLASDPEYQNLVQAERLATIDDSVSVEDTYARIDATDTYVRSFLGGPNYDTSIVAYNAVYNAVVDAQEARSSSSPIVKPLDNNLR